MATNGASNGYPGPMVQAQLGQVQASKGECRYYMLGLCRYKDNCWYQHSGNIPQRTDLEQLAMRTPAVFMPPGAMPGQPLPMAPPSGVGLRHPVHGGQQTGDFHRPVNGTGSLQNVPCRYFSSANGCRNGAQCRYMHTQANPARGSNPSRSQAVPSASATSQASAQATNSTPAAAKSDPPQPQ